MSGGTSNGTNGFKVVFASSRILKPTPSVQKIIRSDLVYSRREIPLSGSLVGILPIKITFEKKIERGEPQPKTRQKADAPVQLWGVCREIERDEKPYGAAAAATASAGSSSADGGVAEFWLVSTNPFNGKGHTRVYQHPDMTTKSMSSRPMDSQNVYRYLASLVRIAPVGDPLPRWAAALLRSVDKRVAQALLADGESSDVASALIRNAVEAIRGPEVGEHELSQLHLVFDHALTLDPSLIFFKGGKYPCETLVASDGGRGGRYMQSIEAFLQTYPGCRSTNLIGATLWRLPYGDSATASTAAGLEVNGGTAAVGDGLSLADLEVMLNGVDEKVEADVSFGLEGHLASLLVGVRSAMSDVGWRDEFAAAEQCGKGQAAIDAVFDAVGKGFILDAHTVELQSEKAALYSQLRYELAEGPTAAHAEQPEFTRRKSTQSSGGAVFG